MDSISDEQPVPYAKIVNQPSSEYDMRYEKEDRKNKIYAENNTSKSKSQYPKVKIVNGEGPATLIVSCVNKTEPYHVHPHKLVGPNCKHGVAVFNIDKNQNTFHLADVSIQFTKKDNIEKGIQELNLKNVDPFIAGFDFDRQSIDLQQVRLCFQIFLRDSFDTTEIIRDKYHILKPVVSQVISNSSCKNTLSIKKAINLSSSCNGGSDVVIFIKKLEKNQKPLKVKFYNSSGWSSIVDIEDSKIHYQCATSFKTPKYPKIIDKEETVFFKLFIPAKTAEEKNIESEEIKFVYTPSESEIMPLNSADVSNQSNDYLFDALMFNQNSNYYLNDSQTQIQISSHEESLPILPAKRTFTDNNCADQTKKRRKNLLTKNQPFFDNHELQNGLNINDDRYNNSNHENSMLNIPNFLNKEGENQYFSMIQNNVTKFHNNIGENQPFCVDTDLTHGLDINGDLYNNSNHPNFQNNGTKFHNKTGAIQPFFDNHELQNGLNINDDRYNNSNHENSMLNIPNFLNKEGENQYFSVNFKLKPFCVDTDLPHGLDINGDRYNNSNHPNFQNNGTKFHNNMVENQPISMISISNDNMN